MKRTDTIATSLSDLETLLSVFIQLKLFSSLSWALSSEEELWEIARTKVWESGHSKKRTHVPLLFGPKRPQEAALINWVGSLPLPLRALLSWMRSGRHSEAEVNGCRPGRGTAAVLRAQEPAASLLRQSPKDGYLHHLLRIRIGLFIRTHVLCATEVMNSAFETRCPRLERYFCKSPISACRFQVIAVVWLQSYRYTVNLNRNRLKFLPFSFDPLMQSPLWRSSTRS